MDTITLSCGKVGENKLCSVCKYFGYCLGGCRAIALAFTNDFLAADPSKCVFYSKGYYQKARKAFDKAGEECGRKFVCVTPIEEFEKEMLL